MDGVPEAVDEAERERWARHAGASPVGPIKMPGQGEDRSRAAGYDAPRTPTRRETLRVVVHDDSMRPTLEPGDRVLVDRGAYGERRPRAGEIVVLVDPEDASRWLVKRVAGVDPATGAVEVRGDASDRARDSRRFGPVSLDAIVGRAVRVYLPPARRRDL